MIAAALFAFIFIFERYFHPAATGPAPLLADLHPAAVTNVQVYPAGAPEISADRTNGGWYLTQPVFYPAQAAAIGSLLDALQKLAPAKIGPAELRQHKNADAEFGFDKPQARLAIAANGQSWRLDVGNRTAPGDQVYLRVVGTAGVFVADAGWLKLLPRTADAWRGTALVPPGPNNYDWIVLTNNARGVAIELRRDPTNHLWRMLRPMPTRADAGRITDALQRLQAASVTHFITDDSNADLSAYGLQPAELDLWLGRGTNLIAAVHVGKSLTNDTTQVYARRGGWHTVVTTARDVFAPWRGSVNDFRDSHLIELTAPVAEIDEQERGGDHFVLREQGSNNWMVVGRQYPADAGTVQLFIQRLASLRIADFVKDVVTQPELPAYGLAKPRREIILRAKAGDTNSVLARIEFGATRTNEVFARVAGEDSVYAVNLMAYGRLPEWAWEFRDRNIWNFDPTNVTEITIHQDGKTRQMIHNGYEKWSLAPGSEGFIEGKYIEQSVQEFHQLTAVGWFSDNLTNAASLGFTTNSLQIIFNLKDGQKDTVDFGARIHNGNTALAAVTLDGKRWGFVFPDVLYQFVSTYLTIPAGVP